jgi:hypothetical protein
MIDRRARLQSASLPLFTETLVCVDEPFASAAAWFRFLFDALLPETAQPVSEAFSF